MEITRETLEQLFQEKQKDFPMKQCFDYDFEDFSDPDSMPDFVTNSWILCIKTNPEMEEELSLSEPSLVLFKRSHHWGTSGVIFQKPFKEVRFHHLENFLDLMTTNAFTWNAYDDKFESMYEKDSDFYDKVRGLIDKALNLPEGDDLVHNVNGDT